MIEHCAIVAAFSPELTPLREAKLNWPYLSFHEVGVGGIEASARMAQVLSDLTLQVSADTLQVLFVGSVGSIDREIPLLSQVVPPEVRFLDYPQLLGKGYWPSQVKTRLEADPKMCRDLSDSLIKPNSHQSPIAGSFSAYTTGAITAEENIAREYRKYACLESLELFGVAMACHVFAVRWACLSTVTNYVGLEGHQQWQANYLQAGELTAQSVKRFFEWRQRKSTKTKQSD